MTTQLDLYNLALLYLGERRLASTSEAREPRYALDDAYGAIKQYCLEQGLWSFAIRGEPVAQSGSAAYGFSYRIPKPADHVRTFTLAAAAKFDPVLAEGAFVDEAGVWYANVAPLHVRYVSNDASFGGDLAKWTQTFTDYVAATLARAVAYRLTGSEAMFKMLAAFESERLDNARAVDSLVYPPGTEQFNKWARFRGRNDDGGAPARRRAS
jgi:hypothetical protein